MRGRAAVVAMGVVGLLVAPGVLAAAVTAVGAASMTGSPPAGGAVAVAHDGGGAAAAGHAAGAVLGLEAVLGAGRSGGATVADIPAPMLALYRAAATTCPGLPWEVLAGIGRMETDHGRAVAVSSAGAEGPMQFLPSTWARYGADANGDGTADVNDPADAVFAAARMLCADGGGAAATLAGAVFSYNHSTAYVAGVLGWAARYAGGGEPPPGRADTAEWRG